MINGVSNNDTNTQKTSNEQTIRVNSNSEEKRSSTIEQQELPKEKVQKITDSLNKLLDTTSIQLRYQFHENLNQYYVTLVDAKTDEVVREIPNKKLLDMYAAMLDFVGVFVDEKI